MRFSPQFLDELRSRLNISDIIGRVVRLQHKSHGEHVGLCPFHKEKTPSFTASDQKGFYHCFGCGAHGDVIKFLMEKNGLGFTEAVSELAMEANMALPVMEKEDAARFEKIDSHYDVLEKATSWFEQQLKSETGREAMSYLKKRGLGEEEIRTFRLGFAPEGRDKLARAMQEKHGISPALLEEVGLITQKEGSSSSYDRFRNRLIFPIADAKGRVIAFGGRILGEGQPKYLNSPETELFKKGYVLYGWDLAREYAYKKKNIVAVEGYMDAIALHKSGIKNVVAPLGTAITENHIHLLWKVAKEPVLCMDGDEAGKRAMKRAAENYLAMMRPGYSLKFAFLPKGEDPDDVIKNHGVSALREILTKARPLSEMIWQMEWESNPPATPEQKAATEARLMKLAAAIKDDSLKQYYRKFFADKIWQKTRFSGKKKGTDKSSEVHNVTLATTLPMERYENILMKLILNFPALLEKTEISEEFVHMDFIAAELTEIQNAITELMDGDEALKDINLPEHLEKIGLNSHMERIRGLQQIENFARRNANDSANNNVALAEWRYIFACRQLAALEEESREVNRLYQSNVTEESQQRFDAIHKQKELLERIVTEQKASFENVLEG